MKDKIRNIINSVMPIPRVTIDGFDLQVHPQLPDNVKAQLQSGEYQAGARDLLSRLLVRGTRVIEIGAGVGLTNLIASRICGATRVTTYDADSPYAAVAEENLRLNGFYSNVLNKVLLTEPEPSPYPPPALEPPSLYWMGIAGALMDPPRVHYFASQVSRRITEVLVVTADKPESDLSRVSDFGTIRHIIIDLAADQVERAGEIAKSLEPMNFWEVESLHSARLLSKPQ